VPRAVHFRLNDELRSFSRIGPIPRADLLDGVSGDGTEVIVKTYQLSIADSDDYERLVDDLEDTLLVVCDEFRRPIREERVMFDFQPLPYLIAVISSPLVVEFARALGGWLLKNPSAKIHIKLGDDGELRELAAEGLTKDQVMALAMEAVVSDDPGLQRLMQHLGTKKS
jgi:hypothetical protein